MVIQGEKVSLRTTEESDLPFLRALWNHGPTMASVGFPEGLRLTRRDVAWWWRHRETRQGRAKYDLCDDVAHMVIELDDGTRVGETGFGRRPVGDIAMLELKVHADHWGLGYGTDALRTLMRHVFDHTDYNVLVVEPAAENDRARALYRRLGFEPRPRMEVLGCENRGLFMALTRRAFRELQDKEPAAGGGFATPPPPRLWGGDMEIRQATAEDWEVLKHLWALCFRDGEPSEATWEEVVDHAEVFVAVEAGRVVGSYQSILFDMHYGEPTLPMGGLAGVATAPTHRGRGIAQGLMRHAVLRMRDTQRPLSMLYAFSLRFYRALGWELIGKSYEFRQLLREVPTAPEAERTREVEAAPGPDFEQVHSRWARQYRGPCDRYPKRWRAQFRRPANKLGYAYVYDGDEGPAGYLHFVPGDDDCEPHEFLSIREFAALTPEAHRGLMGMLRRLGTQYEHAGWHGPADSWVFTEPYDHGLKVRLTDQPMMRATDPGRLLAVRAPQPVSGAYTLRVHEFDWAGGPQTFQVTLDDGRPDVRASVQGPGIEMDPCAFIRCWMGEPDAAALRRAGHVAVHDEEQFSAFCGHFPRAIVWTPEEF